ncbi:HET-domain-containing protein [Microthyrium microscopicum]|uniref:HET-domain-containing protein n=1 Tax=Microthyrium microscopicum TaxID=703497 RepID=A0A6A6UIA7_9PEZI|nr:HET-domain-containing protein [Microthyrium microscopicum]
MRLLNAATIEVQEFLSDHEIPPYAILSHTWGEQECTLQDMIKPDVRYKAGYSKIQNCCQQAIKDGLEWAWVDTCCIDKTSTAELSEAINSMFRYYRSAKKCYAFLSDAPSRDWLWLSRWFRRGWTLQELIAPREVHFYSRNWILLGSKSELVDEIHDITKISKDVLRTGTLEIAHVATKMSWAANRQTSRVEDRAYSLMGIFGVYMPLLYGEGSNAFIRLQQEILRVSLDPSLFAWGLPNVIERIQRYDNYIMDMKERPQGSFEGMLAKSPGQFKVTEHINVLANLPHTTNAIFKGNGLSITLPSCYNTNTGVCWAGISCSIRNRK